MEIETPMSFDLSIAVKRDPRETDRSAKSDAADQPQAALVSFVVNGEFREAGHIELIRRVRQAFEDGADTVTIEMQDIALQDVACLERFAASIMAERAAGRQLQVVARKPYFYATCASIAGSRDWLVAYTQADMTGGRRAIHVDGAGEATTARDP